MTQPLATRIYQSHQSGSTETLNLSDSISLSDIISKLSSKVLSSSINLVDIKSFVVSKLLSDDFGFYDDIQIYKIGQLLLTSVISLYDNVFKGAFKRLVSSFGMNDYQTIRLNKNIFSIINFSEEINRVVKLFLPKKKYRCWNSDTQEWEVCDIV